MLLQHYNYLAIKAAQMPHYGLSWGLVGLGRIRCSFKLEFESGYQPLSLAASFFFSSFSNFKSFVAGEELPQQPHYIGLLHNKDKVLIDIWSLKEAAALACEIQQQAPGQCSKVVSHRVWFVTHTFFVPRELLTHWKCTKECNKDMCHTLHPYYAGNDKWDKQSLQHTVCSALKLTLLTLLTAKVHKPQSLCEMSIQ